MAPFGSKNALGHGRPPNHTDEELESLGQSLLAWMKEMDESETRVVHLSEFYCEYISRSDWAVLIKRPYFCAYYERAIEWIGRRLLKDTELSTAYGSRFLGVYFKEVREHEKEITEHKIDYEIIKKDERDKKSGFANEAQLPIFYETIKQNHQLIEDLQKEREATKALLARVTDLEKKVMSHDALSQTT